MANAIGAISRLGRRGGFEMNNLNIAINLVNQRDLLSEEKNALENRLNMINSQLNTFEHNK